jgi:integrase
MTPSNTSSEQQEVTIEQAAILLGCLKGPIRLLIKRGTLVAVEGTDLVTLVSVLSYLESRRAKQRTNGRRKSSEKPPTDLPGTTFFDKSKNLWYAQSAPDKYGERDKSVGFKSADEAIAWLVQYDKDRQRKIKRTWSKRTLKDFLDFWLEERGKPGQLTHTTIRGYSQKVRLYIGKHIGSILLWDVEPEDWKFLADRLHEETEEKRALAPNTILNTYGCLNAALNWGVGEKYLRENPLNNLKKADKPVGRSLHRAIALSHEQVRRFLAVLKGHRLYALYLIASRLGLRQAELIGLRRANLDLARGELHVVEQLSQNEEGDWVFGPTKNKKNRRIPLSKDLIQALHIHLERIDLERAKLGSTWQDWDLVFPSEVGTPLSARNLVRHFKATLKKAELPEGMFFHDLRHTAGSLMLNSGAPLIVVSEILGHSDAQITARIYGHAHDDAMRRAIDNEAKRFTRGTDDQEQDTG